MVSVDATLRVMGVLVLLAPAGLVFKHVEDILVHGLVACHVLVEVDTLSEAAWDKVVFDTLFLSISIEFTNYFQVGQLEVG